MPQPEVNNVWGQSAPLNQTDTLTLPSGQIVHARRVGLEALIKTGIIGEADALTQLVDQNHLRRGGGKAKQQDPMQAMMRDPRAFGTLMEIMDRSIPLIVVKPEVRLHMVELDRPAADGSKTRMLNDDERQDGVIYTDQIPITDKVDLLNYGVGGLTSLASFREESEAPVATVEHGEGVPDSPQRPAGNRAQRRSKGQPRGVRPR